MVGRLIPAGTGYAYHKKRKARRLVRSAAGEHNGTVSASDVEQALSDALNAENRAQ